ncbi:Agamous-like MADS-box protein AGL15 [Quillaja saponaria]|uniref:Agamous-like MADS-box protein AGL15 n=1 Tax=Quillaja saponaria TaxID=32244 RepID=A0AAD7L0Z0_QUISA|nr:Agamous-like MADS-box protein AGL15 [Quillaja saponaria]
MKRTISRYNKCLDSSDDTIEEYKTEAKFSLWKEESKELEVLKDEIAKLEMKRLRLLGKDLPGLGLKELQHLEQELSEGLFSVKERKEKLLMEHLEQSRVQEQRAMLENETLRRQVEELRSLFPPADCRIPSYREYYPMERKSIAKNGGTCTDLASNSEHEKGDSDTTLHLGLPTDVYQKKGPGRETLSDNAETQMAII